MRALASESSAILSARISLAPESASSGAVHAFFRIHIRSRRPDRIDSALFQKQKGKGFKPFFPGHGGPGPAFGAKGKIDVLQLGKGLRCHDALAQRIGQMAMLLQRVQNGGSSGIQLLKLTEPVPDGCDRNLIQASGGLFAVSGDKGNAGIFFQKRSNRLHLLEGQMQFIGNQ